MYNVWYIKKKEEEQEGVNKDYDDGFLPFSFDNTNNFSKESS